MGTQYNEILDEFYFPPQIMCHVGNRIQTKQNKTKQKNGLTGKEGSVTFLPQWVRTQILGG